MDRLIKRFDSTPSRDLIFCNHKRVAYQADMNVQAVNYDGRYLARYQTPEYSESKTAQAVIRGRCEFLRQHVQKSTTLMDIGACSGAFMKGALNAGYFAKGFDVIPEVVSRLKYDDAYSDDASRFEVITMWDSIEHMQDPEIWLSKIKQGALLFLSVPIMEAISKVRDSKHYKPGEHLYYWTDEGFINWIGLYGFELIAKSNHEIAAGREEVGAYVFKKSMPEYRDYISAYEQIHFNRHYGSSATGLYLDQIAGIVKRLNPKSILDFGCGRSDLVAHFWRDGEREIGRYDPAIPALRNMPDRFYSLVLCCDVLEHIPMFAVDKILLQTRSKAAKAVFTISLKPSRAKLPDGRNAHVTLLTHSEWKRWIAEYYGSVEVLPSKLEHEIVLLAGAN